MLDIKFVRENPDAIDTAMANRQTSWDREKFFELDDERRAVITEVEELQATRNAESKKIGALMKEGKKDEAEAAKEAVRAVNEKIDGLAERRTALEQEQYDFMAHLPNIPCEATPYGKDEDENIERRRWGTPREFDFEVKDHVDVGAPLGLDFDTAAKESGARFAFMRGQIARLHRALAQFMLDTHTRENGYVECYTPYIVTASTMQGTGQLPKFEEDLFAAKKGGAFGEQEQMYLVPTAEVTLTNQVAGMMLSYKDLPLKVTAHTPCFRSEAGAYGRDTRGMIRQHQFDKVEMVRIVRPETSYDDLEVCRTVSSRSPRATWASVPRRPMTLKSGSQRRTPTARFRPAPTARPSRPAAWALASRMKMARPSTSTRSTVPASPSAARSSPCSKTTRTLTAA